MDEYLNVENSYQRLKKEYLEFGRLIIAYDLDCTVYDYHHTGGSFEMVKDLIRKYRDHAYFIVFTSSPSDRYEEIKEILNKENVPFDTINEDAPFIDFTARKVFYNIFLDDRAGLRQTYDELIRLYDECIKDKETSDN